MPANICIDESFDATNGVLSVKRCGGDPEDNVIWPFDADASVANGLHKSDSCGLWVAPATTIAQIGVDQTLEPGNTVTSTSPSTATPLALTFKNKSEYLDMVLALHFNSVWDIGTTAKAFIVVESGFNRDNASVATSQVGSWFRPDATGSATYGYVGSYSDYTNVQLGPQQETVIRLGFKVSVPIGSGTFISLRQSIRGLGITLTNPNPIY